MKEVCDRDSVYMPRLALTDQSNSMAPNRNQSSNINSAAHTNCHLEETSTQPQPAQPKQQIVKSVRKHDHIRKNSMEGEKLKMIEKELLGSFHLKRVENEADVEEFEGVTNSEFNRLFEHELKTSEHFARLKDTYSSRRAARRSGTQALSFRISEQTIKGFTFSKRYDRNRYYGRVTSTMNCNRPHKLPKLKF